MLAAPCSRGSGKIDGEITAARMVIQPRIYSDRWMQRHLSPVCYVREHKKARMNRQNKEAVGALPCVFLAMHGSGFAHGCVQQPGQWLARIEALDAYCVQSVPQAERP
eukprot:COSAG01_NODE_329_length_18724_cov_18.613423_7_plen_108_part_00